MPKKDSMLMLALSLALGLLVAASIRGGATGNETYQGASVRRAQELMGSVARLEEENSALQTSLREATERLYEYENAMRDTGEITRQMAKTLETARMEAGLVALNGSGIVISIDNLVVKATGQVVKYVQDEDLLSVVNELNAAGAEAISINGERIIATTGIRTAGNFININTRAHAAPFVITAIGNPQTLEAAMRLYGGVLDVLSQVAVIDVRVEELVEIPAYQGVILHEYASVAA